MTRRFALLPGFAVLAAACSGAPAGADENKGGEGADKKYALLVGCTRYEALPAAQHLWGPTNDVALMARVLRQKFDFSEHNITQLSGWPADPGRRPTYANIKAAMDSLIKRADPATQVVILFCGHGTQFPIPEDQDPNDPKNPEPDGFDEVFLPADVQGWKKGNAENAILDDEIGRWLDQLSDAGASVWVIFDCCHAGTMTRAGLGAEPPRERNRAIMPQALGVPQKLIDKAIAKAKAAAKQTETTSKPSTLNLSVRGTKGKVVAFYAAQSFEEAPELRRPDGAPCKPENFYGLLTYTLCSALQECQSAVSYGELMGIVASRYRAEREHRGPTPFAEGSLEQEVLGARAWKPSELYMRRDADRLSLNMGDLGGLTIGSVLSVHPPAGDVRPRGEILGYVKVVGVSPLESAIEPCPYKSVPVASAEKLPDRACCRIVEQDFGDMRVKLAFRTPDNPSFTKYVAGVQIALQDLPDHAKRMVTQTPEAKADWLLQIADIRGRRRSFCNKAPEAKCLMPTRRKSWQENRGSAARRFFRERSAATT